MVDSIQFVNVLDVGICFRNSTIENALIKEIVEGANLALNGCNCSVQSLVNSLDQKYRTLPQNLTEEDKILIKQFLNTNDVIFSSGQTLILRF